MVDVENIEKFRSELKTNRERHLNTLIGHIEKNIGQPVNRQEFQSNLQAFIGIFFDTLKACSNPNKESRINSLLAIRDPDGKPLLQNNKEWAEKIVGDKTEYGNRCEEFLKLNNEIIDRYNSVKNKKIFKGGVGDGDDLRPQLSSALSLELQKQIDSKLKKRPIQKSFEVTGNALVIMGRLINPFYMYNFYHKYKLVIDPLLVIPKTLVDMILFPLYTLENIPIVGGIVGIPLDFIGIMIDSSDFLFKLVAPFVPGVVASIMDVLKAIPIMGSFVSIIGIPMNFGLPFIQNLVSNLASIIGFFLSLARKNFSQAYFYGMNFIPFMGSIMRLATRFLYTINRILGYANKAKDHFSLISRLNDTFNRNRRAMSDPLEFIRSFILDNVGKSPSIDKWARKLVSYSSLIKDFNEDINSKKSEIIGAWPKKDIEPLKCPAQGGHKRSKRRRRTIRRRSY